MDVYYVGRLLLLKLPIETIYIHGTKICLHDTNWPINERPVSHWESPNVTASQAPFLRIAHDLSIVYV